MFQLTSPVEDVNVVSFGTNRPEKTLREVVKQYEDAENVREYLLVHREVWDAALDDHTLAIKMIDQIVRNDRHDLRRSARSAMVTFGGNLDVEENTGGGDTEEMRRARTVGKKRKNSRMRKTIMNWPTYSGLVLSMCTRPDLERSVDARRRMVDNQNKALDFEGIVASMMPDDEQTVEQALTVDDVVMVYDEIYGKKGN